MFFVTLFRFLRFWHLCSTIVQSRKLVNDGRS
jgi:hypothetical protein